MKIIHYFAYGSNMSSRRFLERVPSGKQHSVAVLHGYALAFHKRSFDGSAKCGVVETGDPADRVYGVVYTFDVSHLAQLDLAEGNGYSYIRKTVEVDLGGGKWLPVECYFATDVTPDILPYSWYREHVLFGARQAGLPEWYVAQVALIDCEEDPDGNRHSRELSIYG